MIYQHYLLIKKGIKMTQKVAIVTGATKGIGLAIANQLVSDGYRVVGTYVSEYSEETLNRITQGNFELVRHNGNDFDATGLLVKNIIKEKGQVDVLVNNAGIVKDDLMMRMKEDAFDDVMQSNLKSVFNFSSAVTRPMMRQKSGVIVNISSVIGLVGNAGQANYAASKAGVIGFSKSLAKEVASRNVRVNCIAPGYIETSMTDALDESIQDGIRQQIAMKRFGTAQNIADAVSFLVSDKAEYITGQTLNVCGGMVM